MNISDSRLKRATLFFSIINSAVAFLAVLILYSRPKAQMNLKIWILIFIFNILCGIYTSRAKITPAKDSIFTTLCLLEAATILVGIWVNQELFFATKHSFEPFVGYKVLCITIAFIAPPIRWIGFVIMSSAAILSLVHTYRWQDLSNPVLPVQEPWVTLMTIFVAFGLYIYRLNTLKLEADFHKKKTEAESMRLFAQLLIHARHLANTPLQTITNTTQILKIQYPEALSSLDRIQRAVDRLQHVTQLLSKYESHLNWNDVDNLMNFKTLEKQINDELKIANQEQLNITGNKN